MTIDFDEYYKIPGAPYEVNKIIYENSFNTELTGIIEIQNAACCMSKIISYSI